MMKIPCDVCKREMLLSDDQCSFHVKYWELRGRNAKVIKSYDLCPECIEDVNNFILNKQKGMKKEETRGG